MTQNLEAVIWDFGGVFTTSPFDAFNRYEAENRLPKDIIRTVNSQNPDDNAWAKFERTDIDRDGFDELFRQESAALGHEIPGKDILGLLSGDIRPAVIEALKVCKSMVKVGCITNNVKTGKGAGMTTDADKAAKVKDIMSLFDHVIESSNVGVRKPSPEIYSMMCDFLSVDPAKCVYLDDLGINLKPARAMGMTTIKVMNEEQLLTDLSAATGFTFA